MPRCAVRQLHGVRYDLPIFCSPRRLLTFTAVPTAHAQSVVDSSLTVTPTVRVGTLELPTQIRFIGPGDFLVAEKDSGRVRRVQNGALSPTIALDLAIANDSERGLLGLTLDRASHQPLRLSLLQRDERRRRWSWVENRLSRFVWNGSTLGSEVILKRLSSASDGLEVGPNHNAGPIKFGPDGLLYGTTGI